MSFVCPWCALTVNDRPVLEEHWRLSPECRTNRNVSNQTQSKYNEIGVRSTYPGSDTLAKVASKAALRVLHDGDDEEC